MQIVAASGHRVALWHFDERSSSWRTHSDLTAQHSITSVDLHKGLLLLGGDSLSLWQLDSSARLPTWSKLWQRRDAPSSSTQQLISHTAIVSPCGTMFAALPASHNVVRVYRINLQSDHARPKLISEPWHPTPVSHISWKPDADVSGAALFTQTSDGVFRIWATVVDEPDVLALWASVHHGGPSKRVRPIWSRWVDANEVTGARLMAGEDLSPLPKDLVITAFEDG